MDKIRAVLEQPMNELNLVIDEITFENNQLNIVLDTNDGTIIDLDLIVKATKVISPILDKQDFLKEKYILDVSSKERGVE